MKKKILIWVLIMGLVELVPPTFGSLTVTVAPGYVFGPAEVPTINTLNLLGQPTIGISGTLDGTTSLAAGTVTGILLADSVPDGITIGFNGAVPRQLQTLGIGIARNGLIQTNTTQLTLNLDGTLTYDFNGVSTNGALAVNTNWVWSSVWNPPAVWPANGSANAWGYTVTQPITNIVVAGNATQTLTNTDWVPVAAGRQGGSNTVMNLNALAQAVDNNNLKLVATLTVSGTVKTGDIITSVALTDAYGQHTCMAAAYALTVGATQTTGWVVTNVTAAINGSVSSPKYVALAISTTQIQIYEPLVWYAQSGSSAQISVTRGGGSSLAIAGTSASGPPLQAPVNPQLLAVAIASGSYTSPTFTCGVTGGVPPYTYSWTGTRLVLAGGSPVNVGTVTVNSPTAASTTVTCTLNSGQTWGIFDLSCTVTDSGGNTFVGAAQWHFQ